MVWVWPPHTSMNLKWRSAPASSVMRGQHARAATGSRYSSTNLIGRRSPSSEHRPSRRRARAHQLQRRQRHRRLLLVDLRHGEADVDEHPVAELERLVLEQADVDRAAHAGHLDARQLVVASISSTSWPGIPRHIDRLERQLVAGESTRRRRQQRTLVGLVSPVAGRTGQHQLGTRPRPPAGAAIANDCSKASDDVVQRPTRPHRATGRSPARSSTGRRWPRTGPARARYIARIFR